MRKIFLGFCGVVVGLSLLSVLTSNPSTTSSEQHAAEPHSGPCYDISETQRQAASRMIRARGYDCAAVDAMCPYVFSEGFTVYCNHHRYVFELENHGGRWSVTAH
jgi:hypothetical protein